MTDNRMMYQPETDKEKAELIASYSSRLMFLWEQYIKVVQLNIIMSGLTIGMIANLTLLGARMGEHDCIKLLIWSLLFAGSSGLLALIWRFCAQILMERQVYGRLEEARWYFSLTESQAPMALGNIRMYEIGAFGLKIASGVTLLASWLFLLLFAYENFSKHL